MLALIPQALEHCRTSAGVLMSEAPGCDIVGHERRSAIVPRSRHGQAGVAHRDEMSEYLVIANGPEGGWNERDDRDRGCDAKSRELLQAVLLKKRVEEDQDRPERQQSHQHRR